MSVLASVPDLRYRVVMNEPSPFVSSVRLREHLCRSAAASWRRRGPSSLASAPPARPWSVSRHRLLGSALLVVTVVCGYTAAQRVVPAEDEPRAIIREAATRYGVSEELITAVIEAESDFNPRAVSRRGAQGLMQLMPKTAARLGVEDPFSPRENIHGGVRHLRSLMDRFDNNVPLALAAYNAGHVAVLNHKGIPPYPQTRAYVNRIMRRLNGGGGGAPVAETVLRTPPSRRASTSVLR
jgi:soluble lytic murein transglycosylase-like protein